MAGEVAHYLRDRVYPNLNAVEAHLLDGLSPVPAGKAYKLTCPACEKVGRAYYYPGSPVIHCNRRNECGQITGLWDYVQTSRTLSNRDVITLLCEAAGVSLPDEKRPAVSGQTISLARAFRDIIREALWATPEALDYLRNDRRMTDEEIKSAAIGYYPRPEYIRDRLKAARADLKTAEEWVLIGEYARKFSKRIVGTWDQPDGSIRLWGRAFGASLVPTLEDGKPVEPKKYEFAYGLSKAMPYRYRQASRKGSLVAVEGPLDVERMVIHGIPTIGIGGDCVIADQAAFLASKGITSLIHLVDGDKAGYAGALRTIAHCEPCGISVYIAQISPDMDDPDSCIAAMGPEPVQKLLEEALPAGAFIARDVAFAPEVHSTDSAGVILRRLALVDQLTAPSRASFELTMARYGLSRVSLQGQALRQAAALLEGGVAMKEVQDLMRQRYRLEFNFRENQHE